MTAIVTGMYIFAGFRDELLVEEKKADGDNRAEEVKAALGGGEIECAHTISGLAFSAERVVNRVYDDTGADFPGIWEYEVAEELGKWLFTFAREHDECPSAMAWEDQVEKLTREFVARGQSRLSN